MNNMKIYVTVLLSCVIGLLVYYSYNSWSISSTDTINASNSANETLIPINNTRSSNKISSNINAIRISKNETAKPHISTIKNKWKGLILLMHIPKCAGASLHRELAYKCKDFRFFSNEVCYDYLKREEKNLIEKFNFKKTLHMTMIRDPVAHVYSQYLECKYDNWGKTVTNKTSFPRNFSDVEGFDQWLNHFDENWNAKKGYFNCYIPFNAQTRAFTCSGGNNHLLNFHSKTISYKIDNPLYPDLTIAMNNTLQFDHIGVVEYYDASICLFIFKIKGELSDSCLNLCKKQKKIDKDEETTKIFHEKHNVPTHSTNQLTQNMTKKIERLTSHDRILYDNLLKRFLNDINDIEEQYHTQLIC